MGFPKGFVNFFTLMEWLHEFRPQSSVVTLEKFSGTDEERQLLVTAGAELAACGGNMQALSAFGLEWITKTEWLGSLARLPDLGLPIFTAPDANEMQETDHMISSLLPKGRSPHRRLVMAFDRTYLSACTQLCQTSRGHVLVGGRHVPPGFISEDESPSVC